MAPDGTWGGGGAHIHMDVFADHQNNLFKKKLIAQIAQNMKYNYGYDYHQIIIN